MEKFEKQFEDLDVRTTVGRFLQSCQLMNQLSECFAMILNN